jgi:hypothetical protein
MSITDGGNYGRFVRFRIPSAVQRTYIKDGMVYRNGRLVLLLTETK